MQINPIGQEIARLLEPWDDVPGPVDVDGRRSVVAESGTTVDLNMARPEEFEPNRLYVWPTAHRHALEGAGNPPEERCIWSFACLFVVDREDEEPQVSFRRDVADQLDARAHLYAAAVAGHRTKLRDGTTAPWGMIESAVDHGAARTFGVRGVVVQVSGYRIAIY